MGAASTRCSTSVAVKSSRRSSARTPLYKVEAHLPVLESFGFTEKLRAETGGQAFPQCVFDHWEIMPMDPMEEGTKTYDILMDIRKRKGLKIELPDLGNYLDKL